MQTGHNVLKWAVAVISAAIGGSIGAVGGPAGAAAGIVSGLLVGYYYVQFTLELKSRYALVRIILGTLYGALAGLISGASVHIPGFFIPQSNSDIGTLVMGAGFGIFVGTIFGFIVACIIAFLPKEKESEQM